MDLSFRVRFLHARMNSCKKDLGHNYINPLERRTNGIHDLNRLLHRCRFPCQTSLSTGVLALPYNQQLEATTYMKSTFTITIKNPNELNSPSRISIHRSDFPSIKLLLPQPLLFKFKMLLMITLFVRPVDHDV